MLAVSVVLCGLSDASDLPRRSIDDIYNPEEFSHIRAVYEEDGPEAQDVQDYVGEVAEFFDMDRRSLLNEYEEKYESLGGERVNDESMMEEMRQLTLNLYVRAHSGHTGGHRRL